MAFKSLNQILGSFKIQELSPEQQQFQTVLECWTEVVGDATAGQTCPLSIERRVLKVATASAAWSNELTFKAPHILQKLNAKLPMPLDKIRFFPGRWPRKLAKTTTQAASLLWQEHPSRAEELQGQKKSGISPREQTAKKVFQAWAAGVQTRSQGWPICPQCQCRVPQGELQRWTICGMCAAKQF